jgi:hypothetical protein
MDAVRKALEDIRAEREQLCQRLTALELAEESLTRLVPGGDPKPGKVQAPVSNVWRGRQLLLPRIVRAMAQIAKPTGPTEVARMLGLKDSVSNVTAKLKRHPEWFQRHGEGNKVTYTLTEAARNHFLRSTVPTATPYGLKELAAGEDESPTKESD